MKISESADGIDGPGRSFAVEFDLLDDELLYLLADQSCHCESCFGRSMGGIFLVRRFLAGDPHHFLYPRKFQRRVGDGDVSLMERIENPTQQRQGICFLLGVLQPGSPCRKP